MGSMPEVGAVLGTKGENSKESFQNLQESVLQYVVENYKKGVHIETFIMKLEEFDLSSKEPTETTGPGKKDPTEIAKKRYKLEQKKHLDMADILEDNMTKLNSLLYGSARKNYNRASIDMNILRKKKSVLTPSGSWSKSR